MGNVTGAGDAQVCASVVLGMDLVASTTGHTKPGLQAQAPGRLAPEFPAPRSQHRNQTKPAQPQKSIQSDKNGNRAWKGGCRLLKSYWTYWTLDVGVSECLGLRRGWEHPARQTSIMCIRHAQLPPMPPTRKLQRSTQAFQRAKL